MKTVTTPWVITSVPGPGVFYGKFFGRIARRPFWLWTDISGSSVAVAGAGSAPMVSSRTEWPKKPPCERETESKTYVKGFVQGACRTGVGNRGCGGVVSQLVAPDERSFYFALRSRGRYDPDADRRGARRLCRLQCRDPSHQRPCRKQVWSSRSLLCRHSTSIGNLDADPALHRLRSDPRSLRFVGINACHRHRGQRSGIGAGCAREQGPARAGLGDL